jgi:uncharacterized membrane protein
MGREIKIILVACFLISVSMCPALSKTEPVRVLYTGDPYPGQTPYVYMKVEPFLRVTPIQASRDYLWGFFTPNDIRKAIRLYMPRSYRSLIECYDIIIISDSNVESFTKDHHLWFRRAVVEDDRGLVMIGGHETFGTNGHHPDWGQSHVGDLLPVETVYGGYESGRLEIFDTGNVFMESLPWRDDLPFLRNYPSNMVKARPGAEVLARTTTTWDLVYDRKYLNWKNPFFSTWDFEGKGRVFAMAGDWTPGGGWRFMQWEYQPDFVVNLMLYCDKRAIPEDLDLVHTVRMRLSTLSHRRMMIISLVDFIETFGANPVSTLQAVNEVDEKRRVADQLYLDQDFDGALEAANRALQLMEGAEDIAEKSKANALLWVYVSEWLVVTGTSLICGFVIWSLMVRRRLYRDVATTRFSAR